ncbi:MAG: YetF domain-containing protein, partial [Corynebacterium variabile]
AVFGQARKLRQLRGAVASPPEVIMAHGKVIERALRRHHVTEFDLTSALRRAGVTDPAQVRCVIVEPTGALSVLRVGEDGEDGEGGEDGDDIDPWLLRGVVGAYLVMREDGSSA